MTSAIRFVLLSLLLQTAASQTRPDAVEVLKKVGEVFRSIAS
jgi:hypothetical protein